MNDQVYTIQYVFVCWSFLGHELRAALHTTKSRVHENLRALENHPMAVPWDIEIQFCN